MTERRFKSYKTLRARLQKLGVFKPGQHASFFYQHFVLGDSKIYKNSVLQANILENGVSFSEWRDRLVQLKILDFNYQNAKMSIYQPGFKIVDLINQEKSNRTSMASEHFVRTEVKEIKDLLKYLIGRFDPPYSEEKLNEFKKDMKSKTVINRLTLKENFPNYTPDDPEDMDRLIKECEGAEYFEDQD
jgi:hypothetical protein